MASFNILQFRIKDDYLLNPGNYPQILLNDWFDGRIGPFLGRELNEGDLAYKVDCCLSVFKVELSLRTHFLNNSECPMCQRRLNVISLMYPLVDIETNKFILNLSSLKSIFENSDAYFSFFENLVTRKNLFARAVNNRAYRRNLRQKAGKPTVLIVG